MRPDDNEQNVWKSLEAALVYICGFILFFMAFRPLLPYIEPLLLWRNFISLLLKLWTLIAGLLFAALIGRMIYKRQR